MRLSKLIKLIPPPLRQSAVDLKNKFYGGYKRHHYSQFGEDVVIVSLFGPHRGFYVDVGANHPKRYSNTALLYERGWKGMNIDPNKQAISLFKKIRPHDINIHAGVGVNSDTAVYYRFSDPAVNTFSDKSAEEMRKKHWLVELPSVKVSIRPLKDILFENLPKDISIDFLNIDVEGFDFEVLQSNDWNLFHPKVIAVEDHGFDSEDPSKSPVHKFLIDKQYKFIIRMGPTSIFYDEKVQ